MKKRDIYTYAIFILVTIVALYLTSCAAQRRQNYVEKHKTEYKEEILKGYIVEGMSFQEVRAAWGRPTSVSEYPNSTFFHYDQPGHDYTLQFENNKLQSWSHHDHTTF
jgi:outer membrane protein assembly factor BamE (lipoprotein component of BamABCDE complex)